MNYAIVFRLLGYVMLIEGALLLLPAAASWIYGEWFVLGVFLITAAVSAAIGYALRGYERRYDGMVGRYGGDEFVMLMTDIDDEGELRAVLDEMVGDLHVDIQVGDAVVSVHCSIGAAVWDRVSDADALLGQADNALYRVKQHGKEGYFVFGEEDAQ